MNLLELLRDRLSSSLEWDASGIRGVWGQPQLMTKALGDVRNAFDTPVINIPERTVAKVLLAYRGSGILQSFLDLKYACFGIGQECGDKWRLINDDILFPKLLGEVDELREEPRRFRKCYQGLLSGYFGYPLFECETPGHWERLCAYLDSRLTVAQQATPHPRWLTQLAQHRNLLGPKPCECYFRKQGLTLAELHQIMHDDLGVPRESWLWQELIVSQVEEACRKDEDHFKNDLNHLLENELEQPILTETLLVRCTSMLIRRYAQCASTSEHPALRDAALDHIGNPWLKRTSWDAHVKTTSGEPDEKARIMVNGWLKRQLIKDFFELLSDDGSADPRRLNYWLRFEPVIEDMWFALGPYAYQHSGREFKEFRGRGRGRILKLEASGAAQNNAFIMRLGKLVVVEFGVKGNACYIYPWEGLPFDLIKSWVNGNDSGLKNKYVGERFIHRDSDSSRTSWERKLDGILCQNIGFHPKEKPYQIGQRVTNIIRSPQNKKILTPYDSTWEQQLMLINKKFPMPITDHRKNGGAFWVNIGEDWWVCNQLREWGFKYKHGKGWWKE